MTFHTKAISDGVVRAQQRSKHWRLAARRALLAGLVGAWVFGAAFAQTGAAPGTSDKTLGKGGGKPSGPILTRDELRVCFSQEAALSKRIDSVDAERSSQNKEKDDIGAAQQALKVERAKVDDAKKQADDFSVRVKTYSERVASWNQRVVEHNEGKGAAAQAERTRAELNKEKEELTKDAAALEADKTRILSASGEAVANYNAKATALDARISAWNERNAKLNQTSVALEQERSNWAAECADRRYREEDETAIRAGK